MPGSAEIATLVIDCAEIEPMVRMYTALGAVPDPRYPEMGTLLLSGLTLSFYEKPGYTPPCWPDDDSPSQMHLDFFVDSLDEMESHLHAHGATTASFQPHRSSGLVVMIDPAGHPFCIATRL